MPTLNTNKESSGLKCNQCGCDLILKKTKTQKTDSTFSNTTVSTYVCSNKVCQDEIDKRTAKRIELRNEQELARQRRLNKQSFPADKQSFPTEQAQPEQASSEQPQIS